MITIKNIITNDGSVIIAPVMSDYPLIFQFLYLIYSLLSVHMHQA